MSRLEEGAAWNFTLPGGPNAGQIRNFVVLDAHLNGEWVRLERVDTGGIAWASARWPNDSTGGWAEGHSAQAVDVRAVAA